MKKTTWIRGCVLGAALLLAGCGQSTDGKLTGNLELPKIPEVTEVRRDVEPAIEVEREEMIYVPEQIKVEDHQLTFGRLVIHLPNEASVHILAQTEEKGQVLEVSGLGEGKAAPPRIRLACYHVGYEKEIELASAILKEIPGEVLSVVYADYNAERGWYYGLQIEDEIY